MKKNYYFVLFDYLYFFVKQNLLFLLSNIFLISILFVFELDFQLLLIYILTATTLAPSLAVMIRRYDLKMTKDQDMSFKSFIVDFIKLWLQLLPLSFVFGIIIFYIIFFDQMLGQLPQFLVLSVSALSIIFIIIFVPLLYFFGLNKGETFKVIAPYSIFLSLKRFPISILVGFAYLAFIYFLIINTIVASLIFPFVTTLFIYHFCKLLSYNKTKQPNS